MEWCRHSAIQHRVALIEDYDIYTGQKLVQGVDVWLNNPRRPLEASGTSGQKVCFNGGINCSVLDGWWCEGYQVGADGKGINGWAIGEDAHTSDRELQDRIDSQSLYQLLESIKFAKNGISNFVDDTKFSKDDRLGNKLCRDILRYQAAAR